MEMVEGHLLLHLRKHNEKGVLDAGSKEDDDKDEMNKKLLTLFCLATLSCPCCQLTKQNHHDFIFELLILIL